MTPTWRNQRIGEDYVAKHLDLFLIADPLLESIGRVRQWVGGFGDSDHNLILLEIDCRADKPSRPFKFNGGWLKHPDYISLIKDLWIPFNSNIHPTAAIHFVENLSRAKQATKKWAHEKKEKDSKELKEIEAALENLLKEPRRSFSTPEEKELLVALEKRRRDFY